MILLETSNLYDLYYLKSDEKVPLEHLNNDRIRFYIQNCQLFKLVSSCGEFFVVECNNLSTDIFDESAYKEDTAVAVSSSFAKIPNKVFNEIVSFLNKIYEDHGTESCVLLLFNQSTKDWKPFYPVQYGMSGASVKYLHPVNQDDNLTYSNLKDKYTNRLYEEQLKAIQEYNDLYQQGYRISGTMHSHASMPSFFSGTDDEDDFNCNGLHLVIGKLDGDVDFAARMMVMGAEIEVKQLTEVIDGDTIEFYQLPDAKYFDRIFVQEVEVENTSEIQHPANKDADLTKSDDLSDYLENFVNEKPPLLPSYEYVNMIDMSTKKEYLVHEDYIEEAARMYGLFAFNAV